MLKYDLFITQKRNDLNFAVVKELKAAKFGGM